MSNLLYLKPRDHGYALNYILTDDEGCEPGQALDYTVNDAGQVNRVRFAGGQYTYEVEVSTGDHPDRFVGIAMNTVHETGALALDRELKVCDHGYITAYAASEETIQPMQPIMDAANGNITEITTADDLLYRRGRTVTRFINGKRGTIFLN
jgi:hypothetical protein